MSTSSESELDESTLTPEEAKRNRKTSRNKFTRLAKSIENAIAHSKSIEAVELLKQSLKEHYEECMRMHTKCSAEVVAGPDSEEKEKVEKWAYDLDGAYTLVNEAVETYVAKTNAADERSRKQKEKEETEEKNARVAAENLIVQKLQEAEQRAADAKVAAETANKRAETAAEDHAASLIIIKNQDAALKRRHDQEDEEIARKRLAEDTERAELRRRLSTSTTNPVQ